MLKSLDNYRILPIVQMMPYFVAVSLLVILLGVFFAFKNQREMKSPLFLGIDFTGGSYIALRLAEPGNSQEIAGIVKKYSVGEPVVQVRRADPKEVEIRVSIDTREAGSDEEASRLRIEKYDLMLADIGEKFGGKDKLEEIAFDYVGPVVGKELIQNAIYSLIIGSIAIMIYIFIRFNRFAFAVGATIALLHDVLITLVGTAIVRLEVNAFFIAVILTIIGYSINDTIIIYDRIRENLKNFPQFNFPTIINLSITQTLTRSISTVLTVIMVLVALLLLGGRNVYDFAMAMLFGMISGAYSSIFIAAPIVLLFSKERRRARIPSRLNLVLAQEQAVLGEWEVEEAYEVEEVEGELEEEEIVTSRVAGEVLGASQENREGERAHKELSTRGEGRLPSEKKPSKKPKKKARRR